MREREDANRTREAGNRDEVEGVVANTLKLYRNGAVGFIAWLGFVYPQGNLKLVRVITNGLCLYLLSQHKSGRGIVLFAKNSA